MRYLNKIIFVNSAHIPYAEIKLDGNVHFIGTQGVGKSTLLRAILFFYNADKSRLGIGREQRSFDEFYLPYPDSYIVYEVSRENGNFFVLLANRQGRAVFRIVDCSYDKRFLVNEDGSVNYEWSKISQTIGPKVFKSNTIRRYETFRDVIYGNHQNVEKDLRRFCLMESSRYQNVPRTIQNIFLNQSLESRVIKDTIIDSMDFADDSIDLSFYRDHVKNFRQQYDDIWKWYKKEKNGKIKVQGDAEHVISKYTLYELTRKAIGELCGNLNYALERDRELLPQIENRQVECSQELGRQKRLLSEESSKYRDERDKLYQKDGALKSFLDKVKDKRQHYAEIGIESIIARIEKEEELKIREDSLKHQEAVLTGKNQSVKAKYDALKQEVDTQLKLFQLEVQQRMNLLDSEKTQIVGELQSESGKRRDEITSHFNDLLQETQNRKEACMKEKAGQQARILKIQHMNPFRDKMDEFAKKIETLKNKQEGLKLESINRQQEVDRIIHESELKRKDLESECTGEIVQIENRITTLKAEIEKLDELLGQQKGSLIEWLGENVDGWEKNIGKVLDEKNVLYNTTLNPVLATSTDNIFGVSLSVENIENTIRTPEDIKVEKAAMESEADNLKSQIVKRRQKLKTDIEELERRPGAVLKRLRMEKMNIDAELSQLPQLIENTQKMFNVENDRLTEWRKVQLDETNRLLAALELKLTGLAEERDALMAQAKRETDNVRKDIERRMKEATVETERKKQAFRQELDIKEKETSCRKKEMDAQMDAELKGLGVDVNQLTEIRKQLQTIANEFVYINTHRKDYISWQNDMDEYFNNEQAKKEERRQLKQKLDDLQSKFNDRKSKLDTVITRLSDESRALSDQLKQLKDIIEKVELFIRSNDSNVPMLLSADKIETTKLLSDILEELRNNISSQQRRMEEFKVAVNTFKNNFSAQNTFHFRTEFNSDVDYTEFAAELNEFLSNKKIEEYRLRTSETYGHIIQRISREVSDLMNHTSQIQATIGDINKDFRENNFAGVIKDIELRAVESNDRLMQQLFSIKKFDDDNPFNIGELNLFSDEIGIARTNQRAVELLMMLIDLLDSEQKRERVTLTDTFKLEFKVKENDNDTNWVEKLSNVGSDGTDILVKAMVNIMLINVFKRKVSRRFGEFKLHCMMDEIGKLHPNNVEGILDFANKRNIYLINSSPTTYNASAYRYTYSLNKDERSYTIVKSLLTIR